MVIYLSFSRTCESLPRPYLHFLTLNKNWYLWCGEMKKTWCCLLGWSHQTGVCTRCPALHAGSLVMFIVIFGFKRVKLVAPEPKLCLAIPFCSFRLKLAINAVIFPIRQHVCHAENTADLEWPQTQPGGADGGEGNGVRVGERPVTSSIYETYALLYTAIILFSKSSGNCCFSCNKYLPAVLAAVIWQLWQLESETHSSNMILILVALH